MHRSFVFLFLFHSRVCCKPDRAKGQSSDRCTPRKEIQKERGLQNVDDHQKGQDNAQQHQKQAKAEKEAGIVHIIQKPLNHQARKVRKEKL
jgi:hypothetical protein